MLVSSYDSVLHANPGNRFKVEHSDLFGRDDMCGWACIRLDRLNPGLRFIHLWSAHGKPSDGLLLAKIEFGWNP